MSNTPYYETELGKLYHGDCLSIMPMLEPVDLVLTDPQYGMDFQSNHRMVQHDKITGDDKFPIERVLFAIDMARRAAYFCCRWDNLTEVPKPKSVIAWVKNNWSMGDLKHEHGRQWEAICFYPKELHEFKKRIPDVIFSNRTGNKLHPTQKPVDMFMTIILSYVCDSILDPFMGSGTTAIACERLNRRWIGIEIEEKYCEIAAKRIEKENQQLRLFK